MHAFSDPFPRLIAHASVRYCTLDAVRAHPLFKVVPWDNLRGGPAPFVPALDSDEDTGYYDDFTSPEDMAKYAEVREKQRNVDRLREKDEPFARGVWVGFTFGKNGPSAKALNAMADGSDDRGTLATIF
jgi:cell cycle protein kinase DBF2